MQHFTGEDIKIGDWVMGEEQLLHANVIGYVENVDLKSGLIYLHVTETDHDELRECETYGNLADFIMLDEEPPILEGEVLNLIDMALDERNYEWLNKLLMDLKMVRSYKPKWDSVTISKYEQVK